MTILMTTAIHSMINPEKGLHNSFQSSDYSSIISMEHKFPDQNRKHFHLFNISYMDSDKVRQNVRNWIKALESGDFQQGGGQLEIRPGESFAHSVYEGVNNSTDSLFCCLGVANKVCDLGNMPAGGVLIYNNDKVGLQSCNGLFTYGDTVVDSSTLYELNDSKGWTFAEIAQLLKDQYKVVMTYRRHAKQLG